MAEDKKEIPRSWLSRHSLAFGERYLEHVLDTPVVDNVLLRLRMRSQTKNQATAYLGTPAIARTLMLVFLARLAIW